MTLSPNVLVAPCPGSQHRPRGSSALWGLPGDLPATRITLAVTWLCRQGGDPEGTEDLLEVTPVSSGMVRSSQQKLEQCELPRVLKIDKEALR